MLTIVTNTRYERPEMLERCKASVAAALPPGARHEIIPVFDNWGKNRYESLMIDEYVAVVDDDDTIHPDSIKKCIEALEATGAGYAFTNEVVVDASGNILMPADKSVKTYLGIASHPRTAHHLGVYRRSALNEKALELHNMFNIGIDWFSAACASFSEGGAVFVPMDGYFWTRHSSQDTKTFKREFDTNIVAMGQAIRRVFDVPHGIVPVFTGTIPD